VYHPTIQEAVVRPIAGPRKFLRLYRSLPSTDGLFKFLGERFPCK
jgi:hypothetical protein